MGDHKEKKTKMKPNKASKNDKRKNGEEEEEGNKVIADPRFALVHSDPRFQNVPKRETKVKIDERFKRMFTNKNFASSSTAPLDKRGKYRKSKPDSALGHYYRIHDDKEEDAKTKKKKESESEELEESDRAESSDESGMDLESETEQEDDDVDASESSESSSTDVEDELEVDCEDDIPQVEENVPLVQEATRRLAVVNMDWRHVRAVDLYAVLRSFLPKGGDILSVSIYPSEFGLQRMKEEEVRGPVGLFDDEDENSDGDDKDNGEIDHEKLRAYEKSRLRYYYAVVECDSVSTADHIYKACDGTEFERSSNVLDLRFIPNSMEFNHPPRDVANEVPASYEGLDFHTKALQHSSIPISWDEDEPQRVKKFRRNFNDDQLAEMDLKEFLASDESETDDNENDNTADDKSERKKDKLDKYRALLLSGDGSDGDGEEECQDMEVTFNPGLEDLSKHILEKKNRKSESVWEEVLRKQREKRNAHKRKSKDSSDDENSDNDGRAIDDSDDFFLEEPSFLKVDKKGARDKRGKPSQDMDEKAEEASRAELELLLADDKGIDNGAKGYNLKPKKAKGKTRKKVLEEDKIPTVDYDDPRFSALFSSPLYALDPTDPQFKRSAAYARQVAQKLQKEDQLELHKNDLVIQRKRALLNSADLMAKVDECSDPDGLPLKKEKHELSSLVRSIKVKSKQVQPPSKVNPSKKHETMPPRSTNRVEAPDLSTLVQSVKKKAKVLKNGKYGMLDNCLCSTNAVQRQRSDKGCGNGVSSYHQFFL